MTVTIGSRITAGVDTHLDVHVVAALDERGGLLGVESFETTAAFCGVMGTWTSPYWMKSGTNGLLESLSRGMDRW